MDKKYAFFFSAAITAIVMVNYYLVFGLNTSERETVFVLRAIDGDTLELEDGRTIRLININTPERGRPGYENAKKFLANYENKTLELEVMGVEKYGRILGRVYEEDYINLEIVKLGLAHSYLVESDELKKFKKAERQAQENRTGIWEMSEHHGCLKAQINKKEEFVIFDNSCNVDIEGWSMKDESTKAYKFTGINSGKFTVFSEKGEDRENEFYWGRGNAWNDDKDSIFIRDRKGKLVFYDSYGY